MCEQRWFMFCSLSFNVTNNNNGWLSYILSSYIYSHSNIAYVDNDNDRTCCRLSVTPKSRKHNKQKGNVYFCMWWWHFYNYLLLLYFQQCRLSTNNKERERERKNQKRSYSFMCATRVQINDLISALPSGE